jgi:uncharacterized OsmC-like protein
MKWQINQRKRNRRIITDEIPFEMSIGLRMSLVKEWLKFQQKITCSVVCAVEKDLL